ncbi:MAG: hypothetical protein MI785_17270 [Kiloniellales bacterium]|nr:hypothetical protein [Kiloniellales bacterium]
MSLKVIDSVSDPGLPAKPNDDRLGYNACCAFVIDGATGLGDEVVMPGFGSDAAWLAERARLMLERQVAPDSDLEMLLAGFSRDARELFEAAAAAAPRYAWPSASFAMLRKAVDSWEFAGLGDCSLFLQHDDGTTSRHSALAHARGQEQASARRHIALTGGFGKVASFHRQPETLAALRRARQLQNTDESGVWTLGLAPEAARYLVRQPLRVSAPATGLLCSDGFADLVDSYGRYSAAALIDAASRHGMRALVEEIRDIERRVDPDGLTFPRFKQSDDATALLVELG